MLVSKALQCHVLVTSSIDTIDTVVVYRRSEAEERVTNSVCAWSRAVVPCGPSSPYSFVIGPESVEDLLEVQSLQELTALIGLDEELMRRRLAEGSTVNLLLFEVDPSLLIPPT